MRVYGNCQFPVFCEKRLMRKTGVGELPLSHWLSAFTLHNSFVHENEWITIFFFLAFTTIWDPCVYKELLKERIQYARHDCFAASTSSRWSFCLVFPVSFIVIVQNFDLSAIVKQICGSCHTLISYLISGSLLQTWFQMTAEKDSIKDLLLNRLKQKLFLVFAVDCC